MIIDMTKKNSFDPDQLGLTKHDILNFCNRVLEKWNKNPTPNTNHILAMNAVKTAVLWTDDESLKVIWSEIIGWTFELLYENALSQNQNEWTNIMKKLRT